MSNPNIIAYLVLALWPFVAWQLWRRLDPGRALIWTILGGYLLLPPLTVFNFPLIPDLDKMSVPNLMALACALWLVKDKISFVPHSPIGKALIVVYVLSPFGTVLTNTDPLIFRAAMINGMRIYDSLASIAYQIIALLPFFLARRYLGTPEGMRAILAALVAAGLAYSVPMLIEVAMSPQMNVWVYGFFQHDFWADGALWRLSPGGVLAAWAVGGVFRLYGTGGGGGAVSPCRARGAPEGAGRHAVSGRDAGVVPQCRALGLCAGDGAADLAGSGAAATDNRGGIGGVGGDLSRVARGASGAD